MATDYSKTATPGSNARIASLSATLRMYAALSSVFFTTDYVSGPCEEQDGCSLSYCIMKINANDAQFVFFSELTWKIAYSH